MLYMVMTIGEVNKNKEAIKMSEKENCRWIKHRKCDHDNANKPIIGEKSEGVRSICDLCLKAYTAESLHDISAGLEFGKFAIAVRQ